MNFDLGRRNRWLVAVLLAAVTLEVFWSVRRCEFTNFDDPDYVTENDWVSRGLTWAGAAWAFQHSHAGNWHPLTSLSHMLDVTLFGLNPTGHHLMNLAWHTLNSLLLLAVLWTLTGAWWRSAMVAGLFALHPMHVESVAWISERKDMLSTFFGLMTLFAYASYAVPSTGFRVSGSKSKVWYAVTLLCFAFGLMSKPMLVTWPFVLLLLDLWPLRRLAWPVEAKQLRQLVVEKWPFFLLTIVLCVITYTTQSEAGAMSEIPFSTRLARVFVAYASYVAKLLLPLKLAVFYPLPQIIPWWELAGAVVLLVVISLGAVRVLRRLPELAVGWFWFLGTLVPVIGLVQVGQQLMADRYAYIPAIGFFVAVVWGVAALLQRSKANPVLIAAGSLVWLAALGFLTVQQTRTWRNSEALYTHALRVTENNHVAHNNLAALLQKLGRYAEADAHAAEALRISPNFAGAHMNWGNALIRAGKTAEALEHLQRSLALEPTPITQYNLANLWRENGDPVKAEQFYRAALAKRPHFVDARYNLGLLLAQGKRNDEAQVEFEKVLAAQPAFPGARLTLGAMLAQDNHPTEAAAVLRRQIELVPTDADARFNLGQVLLQLGRVPEAREQFAAAAKLQPEDPGIRQTLGATLLQEGQIREAITQLQEAISRKPNAAATYQLALAQSVAGDFTNAVASLRQTLTLQPDWVSALNDLAWTLATVPDAAVRRPEEAVRLALRACELTTNQVARCLGTLDAAYGAAGQFENAIATALRVAQMSQTAGDTNLAALAKERLLFYRAGKPYVQSLAPPAPAAPATR